MLQCCSFEFQEVLYMESILESYRKVVYLDQII
jgi:hypothetical protein